ncbi:sensor histidine kinase [Agrobacterium rosae]|uniref:sensor histidine kinase n=1 Tax=Agrobacterium rosae TaxID=1972867 RepID=UPI003B9ECD63
MLESEREIAELREQFIAVLGHDLRNPIAALNAGTSRPMKEGWTEHSPVILKLMKTSTSRMSGMVDNVMDLARVRMGGGLSLKLSEDNLADTLQHVVEELRVAHPNREICASFAFPNSITVDHPRMAQMVSNLLSNAIVHGSEIMPVKITGTDEGGVLKICVANGGPSIPSGQIDNLFLPFRRGEGRSGAQGLGLGLYIASQIAHAHSAKIEVYSDDVETRFAFGTRLAPT